MILVAKNKNKQKISFKGTLLEGDQSIRSDTEVMMPLSQWQ